ncbi:MAG: site-specific DNA-methyltransferase [Deltaproteobacteria bacterium]|nr:site-specific DNA-methyltransferase [Deltaproteobacteria bacterium]
MIMAKEKKKSGLNKGDIESYRHESETRKNAVPVGLASYDTAKPKPKKYEYDPHLDPQLVWAGKKEHTSFEVPTVSLHIHEHIAPEAIIRSVKREPTQPELFAKPEMPLKELVEFYQHEMDWTNRLILGDSLLIMNSLLEREMMGGKVQTIFVDPPYGVKFSSNFQPSVKQRDVKDSDEFMVREPEQIKAYRDTWQLGIHSYLAYLRDRLLLSRDLLTDSGSIFVQISDENMHHVRELMDEVFEKENFVSLISFTTTSGIPSNTLSRAGDYILWYAKDLEQIKYRQQFKNKDLEDIAHYNLLYLPDGKIRRLSKEETEDTTLIPKNAKLATSQSLTSQGATKSDSTVVLNGIEYRPPSDQHWKTTVEGIKNLFDKGRLLISGKSIRYLRFDSDFPVSPINNIWTDTVIGSQEKEYVVQTSIKTIQRCILMTTDPGDLVFDPTCGSGTTAYVAEQWGRRWLTCDTSRVALTLARQRLMTAVFPYYKLADDEMGVKGGFIYEEVPHVTLKSIAQNEPSEKEILFDKPEIDRKRIRVAGPLTVEGIPQHSTLDFADANYEAEVKALSVENVIPAKAGIRKAKNMDSRLHGNDRLDSCSIRVEADNHVHTLIELLRKDGVTFPGNKKMKFENLISVRSGFIHAEGEPVEKNGIKKVAVSFGPPHGPVTVGQVQEGIREAHINGYNGIIFCGFAFDSSAMDVKHPKVKVFYSHIRPDVLVGDLLKTTASSQLFTVFGEPDIEIKKIPNLKSQISNPEYEVILKGVDIYDPLTGEVYSDNGNRIAAWFIDTDYDKRAFCISQAFFPDSTAWDKLKRALKATIDEDKFELLTSTQSLPFKLGKEKRIAVKVIDHRGNEVMVVREVG